MNSDSPLIPDAKVVASKVRTCGEPGIFSRKIVPPADTTQGQLLEVDVDLNSVPAIHGSPVQSPPTRRIDEAAVISPMPHLPVTKHLKLETQFR